MTLLFKTPVLITMNHKITKNVIQLQIKKPYHERRSSKERRSSINKKTDASMTSVYRLL